MPRNLWIWDYTWGIQQLSWKIEHAKEDLWVNLIETNKLIDEVKIENQSLKVKVEGLEDDLVKFKAKLENVSNLKSVVEPKYKSTLIKPKDVKVYVPPFKRNHNEEKDNFSRKDKSKRTVNECTCHHCGLVGHIRPNCLQMRSQFEIKVKLTSWKQSRPKSIHVCHHCGVPSHTHPNCFKLHPEKRVSKLSIEHNLVPLVKEY